MPIYAITGQLCAGKHTIADWLCEVHGFTRILVRPQPSSETNGNVYRSPTKARTNGILDGETVASANGVLRPTATPAVSFSTDDLGRRIILVPSAEALLDYATRNWRDRLVTTDVQDRRSFALLSKRPFFLLISVESPLADRFDRFARRCRHFGTPAPSLEEFVRLSDDEFYGTRRHRRRARTTSQTRARDREVLPQLDRLSLGHNGVSADTLNADSAADAEDAAGDGTSAVFYKAALRIVNAFSSVSDLHAHLAGLDMTSALRMRPSWDAYFMSLAQLAALRSNCMKRRVGCVLVRANRVIATGYNGTPRGVQNCSDGGCDRCNAATEGGAGLSTCLCLHAEENALLEAGRERISGTLPAAATATGGGTNGDGAVQSDGAKLYCNTCPCLTCAVKIAQVGVHEVIYNMAYSMDDRSASILRAAGVVLRQFSPPYED